MPEATPALMLVPLTANDLEAITAIHLRAFPKRAMSALGADVVSRYYAWLLSEAHPNAYRMGAWRGGALVGFNFAGRFNGAMTGFLQHNRNYLIAKVLRCPWLLVTNELFRDRITMALGILNRRPAPQADAAAVAKRHAYLRGFGILAIAVDPLVQGGGVGKALMADAEAEARRRSVEVMNLSVAMDNAQAIAFYERIGWQKQLNEAGVWVGEMIKPLVASDRETPITPQ